MYEEVDERGEKVIQGQQERSKNMHTSMTPKSLQEIVDFLNHSVQLDFCNCGGARGVVAVDESWGKINLYE